MELLRMKGQLTRLLILRSMLLDGLKHGASIARTVGITSQGASEHLREMEKEGLVHRDGRTLNATAKGMEYLQSSLLQLKGFADTSIGNLEIIRSTDAISEGEVRKGMKVNLYMKRGLLYAGEGPGSSSGIAETDASPGGMVQVGDLQGLVDMEIPPLRLVEVPPARSGGGSARLPPEVIEGIGSMGGGPSSDRVIVAALDMESAAMLIRSDFEYHLEMPSQSTVAGYLMRGRPILAFGTPHSLRSISEYFEREHNDIELIRVEEIRPV
ncbi:MAG: hypothetical protein QCI82_06500 [Candidatus Thermoplasmatota archaeon]|nr:hypothetical protein [Candidatus Thermoplasmatota archaeon]